MSPAIDTAPVSARRPGRARIARFAAVGALAATLGAASVAAGAGTPRPDMPGSPPASATVTTAQVLAGTQVTVTGSGWIRNNGQPQQFMVKFDDHGDNGIGPYTAAADGTFTKTISLTPPAGATPAQRKDYAPADLKKPGTHWVRLLSGDWDGKGTNLPARSVHATFQVVAQLPTPDPTPTTPTPPTPGTPTPTPSTPGTTPPSPAAPGTPAPGGATPSPTAPSPATPGTGKATPKLTPPTLVRSSLLRAGNRVIVRVRGGDRRVVATVTVTTARRVRPRPKAPARTVVVARARAPIAAGGFRQVRPVLTAAGKRLLKTNPKLRVTVRMVRPGASPTARVAFLLR